MNSRILWKVARRGQGYGAEARKASINAACERAILLMQPIRNFCSRLGRLRKDSKYAKLYTNEVACSIYSGVLICDCA